MKPNRNRDKTSQNFSGFEVETTRYKSPAFTPGLQYFLEMLEKDRELARSRNEMAIARTFGGTGQNALKPFSSNVNEDSPNYPFS